MKRTWCIWYKTFKTKSTAQRRKRGETKNEGESTNWSKMILINVCLKATARKLNAIHAVLRTNTHCQGGRTDASLILIQIFKPRASHLHTRHLATTINYNVFPGSFINLHFTLFSISRTDM